jgi:mRNA interferase YafQ
VAEVLNRLQFANSFKKDYRKAAKHPEYSDEDIEQLLDDLIHKQRLPPHYREHNLQKRGVNWVGYSECHLGGDLIVIYRRFRGVVRMHRIGSHADLFRPQSRKR